MFIPLHSFGLFYFHFCCCCRVFVATATGVIFVNVFFIVVDIKNILIIILYISPPSSSSCDKSGWFSSFIVTLRGLEAGMGAGIRFALFTGPINFVIQ